nr:hypothetical protein [Tanacetum cinerariifolium]
MDSCSRLSGLERAQTHIYTSMSSFKEDTNSIKTMMTEMYEVFKGQYSGSVTLTLALTHILVNVEGENDTNIDSEDPLSHIERETDANKQEKSEEHKHSIDANIEFIGKGITTDEQVEDQRKLVKALSIIHPDLDALIPYTINREVYYLIAAQLQLHMDKEEIIKKVKEEARLFAISKPEVIKVVWEEAKKLRIHPKEEIITKPGEKFKKAQDAEHETISSRLKRETITAIKILLKTKPVVITFFRGTDDKNFDVYKPFAFALPKNVLFVNNMVIEEPEHGIFFTDKFDDQEFQRWSDIDKVRMESFVSYLVAAYMVQTPKNARFSMKLKKLIAKHPDQEKLKLKKVKMEALGYEMN